MRTSKVIQGEVPYALVAKLMAVFLLVLLALRLSSLSIIAVGALVVYATIQKRVEFAFFTLMLLVSLSIINPVFFEKGFTFYLVTRGSLFVLAVLMTVKAGFRKNVWYMSPFYVLFAYVFFVMVTSLDGWAPIISELKALLFLVFMGALTQCVAAVNQSGVDIRTIRAAMMVIAIFFILGSVATIPFPQIGKSMMYAMAEVWGERYDPSGSSGLFNGVTWHSQTLGPLVAILNAYVLSDYLCNFRKKNWLYRIILCCVPIIVYITSSRTALLAYLVSVLSSVFFFMQERKASAAKKSQVLIGLLFAVFMFVVFLVLHPRGLDELNMFLHKVQDINEIDDTASLTESLTSSRMGLVELGLYNFHQKPLIGNGFQVSEEMKYMDRSDLSRLLSAPIEKGVLPVMILEEGGAVGAGIFVLFILMVYFKYKRIKFNCFLSTFTVFIALNSGEASFFSTSGAGGILWMICFSALLMDIHRQRRELAEMQAQQMQMQAPAFSR